MSNYKHGNWYCTPNTQEEAAEIVRLAVNSGADNKWCFKGNRLKAYGVFNGVVEIATISGAKYTIDQLRAMLDEKQWSGEGLPPVGTVCEAFNHNLDSSEWERCVINYMGPFIVVYESESCIDRSANHGRNEVKFRPLRTNREKWIEAAVDSGSCVTVASAEAIYDAGLAKDV